MGRSCDVNIEVDRSENGGTFTNYDIIRGVVNLTVTTSISLNYIQVKLEGISRSQLVIPAEKRPRKDRDKKDKMVSDIHKVLYESSVVFPPDNVQKVSQAKEFTLTPGNYQYPFEFRIPLNNSCVKLQGITNKVLFNRKTFDINFINGSLNCTNVKNMAQKYYQHYTGSQNMPTTQEFETSNYHLSSQLPPSLSGMQDFASIKYFVKVTCKRSSFLKTNLRAYDPIIFLPLDLDTKNRPLSGDFEEYKEEFIRRELIFKNRIPSIVGVKVPPEVTKKKELPNTPYFPKRKSFLQKVFSPALEPLQLPEPPNYNKPTSETYYPEISSKDVPFSFEVRFRHPSFLIPTKLPSFRLFLISKVDPLKYTLSQYGKPDKSNGLGVVYLQELNIELISTTVNSVIEDSTGELHKGRIVEKISMCKNRYKNLKFDLKNCRKQKSDKFAVSNNSLMYELEIPKEHFQNAILPDHVSPSFKTCNISRSYTLTISAGFSDINLTDSQYLERKVKHVDLVFQNIRVVSGLNMTSTLHANSSGLNVPQEFPSSTNEKRNGSVVNLINGQNVITNNGSPNETSSNSTDAITNDQQPVVLPTYDDVMRESTFQHNSDHLQARRRYQQHERYYHNLE